MFHTSLNLNLTGDIVLRYFMKRVLSISVNEVGNEGIKDLVNN